jgi:hypothetical protein
MTMKSHTAPQEWSMWLLVFAVIAVIGAGFLGWFGKWEHGIPSDAVVAGKVVADGTSYYGRYTKTYGYVSTPVSGNVFSITDVAGTASLPVIVKGPGIVVSLGEKVLVEGTPTAFDSGRMRQDYGINLPDESTRGWENRPVVIATKVLNLD